MAPQCKTLPKSLVSHLRISKLPRQDLDETYLMVHRKTNTWPFCSQYCSGAQDTANNPENTVTAWNSGQIYTLLKFWLDIFPVEKNIYFRFACCVLFQVFCAIGATHFQVKENKMGKPSCYFATEYYSENSKAKQGKAKFLQQ